MPTVLAVLTEGFEEIEAVTPVDLLRRAGVEVTTASTSEQIHVTGRSGITLHADTTLTAVAGRDFDCVFLPGGPGAKNLRADPRVRVLVLRQNHSKRWIAAICAAPAVLQDIGLLLGRRYTAHFSVATEMHHLISNERVVIDGNIITSRGAGTAVDFGFALIEKLVSPTKAREVAQSVCA
ncbi:MAG: DJ-1/PfpI family protein [Verrucomicrobiota bacterium]|nr:DJ-1/PfpI family protein [Verrucomicrobiota bacterium]